MQKKPTHERNLSSLYIVKDFQKTEEKIILRVLITCCLLTKWTKRKISSFWKLDSLSAQR